MYILWTSVNAVKTSVSVDVDAELETHKSLVTNHRIRFIVNQLQKKTEMHYSFHGIRPNKTKQLNSCFGRSVAFCVEVLFCGRVHLNMLLWRILFSAECDIVSVYVDIDVKFPVIQIFLTTNCGYVTVSICIFVVLRYVLILARQSVVCLLRACVQSSNFIPDDLRSRCVADD